MRAFVAALPIALACVGGAHAQGKAQLDAVSIHLFLDTSGALSPDVATIKGFGAWNFAVQGEGIAEGERFHAALIRVRLTAPGEVFARGPQASVIVTDRRARRVVRRERIADVYIGTQGAAYVPIFLADAACGPFDVVVTGSGRRITAALEAACGK